MRILRRTATVAVLLMLSVWAQTPTGSIEGTVTDPSGAVIANAKISVVETATGRTVDTTATSAGYFELRNLLPGDYTVNISAPGFATRQIKNVTVNSGGATNANAQLEIGKTGDIVEVQAQAVMVDTDRQTVDSVINTQQIKDLPLFSRNFLDLATLAPGVNVRDGGAIDPTKSGAYRAVGVNGRSGTGTRVQVDGIDVTDETVGTTVTNISNEAVQQFQLTRSSLDISTSLTSSGSVNISRTPGRMPITAATSSTSSTRT